MNMVKILAVGLMLTVLSSAAYAQLPSNGDALLNEPGEPVRFSVNMTGMEIDWGTVYLDDQQSVDLGTGAALGYVPETFDPTSGPGSGLPGGLFVLYDSQGQIVADVNAAGLSSSAGFPNLVSVFTDPRNSLRAFGVGIIDNVQAPDGELATVPQTFPGAPATTQQLTFAFRDLELRINSPTPANFEAAQATDPDLGPYGTSSLTSIFSPDAGLLSIFEDSSTDADSRASGIAANANAPAGELPVDFFDPMDTGANEYFDATGTDPAFRFVDSSDPDQTEVLRLDHIGGMQTTEVFNTDLRTIQHPIWGEVTVVSGGRSSFSDNQESLIVVGGDWAGEILDPGVGFRITTDVAFGLTQTGGGSANPGVLPEDPYTFTFQTPGAGGPEIFGGRIVPEPVTLTLLGAGLLAVAARRRR